MKEPTFRLALFGLAAALALTACESSSVEPRDSAGPAVPEDGPARSPSAYESEVLSLKSGIADPESREAAIRAAMVRHGFLPAGPEGEAEPESEKVPQARPAPAAAAKTNTYRIHRAKDFEFGFNWTITRRVTVANGATLNVYTTREADAQNVDPRLVAYYPEGTDPYRTRTRIVGLNDDNSGLDAGFSWTNNTGSSRLVSIHAFAYSSSSRGAATLKYRVVSASGVQGSLVSKTGNLQATAVTASLPEPFGCSDPAEDSQIEIRILQGGGFNAGLVAVNAALMQGGYLREGSTAMVLGDAIPSFGGNFLLGIFEGDGGNVYEISRYRALQDDYYPFCT